MPQTHEPGGEAEVDFADLWVILRGVKTKTFLFTLRLTYSGKSVHRGFATQAQEAFLEGHVAAFTVLGGTPIEKLRFDNLKAAVSERAVRSRPGGIGPLDSIQVPSRFRRVLLPPRLGGGSRERRGAG